MKTILALLVLAQVATAAEPTTKPIEIRRGVEFSHATTNPAERQKLAYERIVKKIEPSGVGDPARLDVYLEFFKREFVEDPRMFAIDIKAERQTDGTIALHGYVEYDEHRAAVESFLKQLGFAKIVNGISLLPDAPETGFGIVKSATFVVDRTTTPRENMTQCLPGDRIYILRTTMDDCYLIHAADGYVGYVLAKDVERVEAAKFHEANSGTNDAIEKSIASAMELMGTKYVWGGKTKDGVDCSGLIQSSFKKHGVNLPRDADQQAYVGRLVATRWDRDGLHRGDLLYFLSRRGSIHHTAIYLGDGKFLEAADPGVKITSFNKADPAYDAKRDASFCFAKRVLE
ncbi:MAG TPA: C40 family peptidase [Tepidisphaeraceae bacterium]|jgi:cell wall-associated NlpC family hydrolase|nr:C40 family peptidase [Tepidisphaeraceae bacterium]